MVEGLWHDEEDVQVAKFRRRLFRKPNKTPEDWRLLWDLAPPFHTPEGWFWVDPFHLTPHLMPSQMQRMNEHAYNHRPGALPPDTIVAGASTLAIPSSSQHVAPGEAQGELPSSRD
jgi:hypothetical protein